MLPVFQSLENHFYYVHNERTDDTNLTYTIQLITNLVSNVWNVVTNKVPTLGKDQQFIRLKIEKD